MWRSPAQVRQALRTALQSQEVCDARIESLARLVARPRVLEGGEVIEKSAVHFTHSRGASLPPAATLKAYRESL